MSPIIFRPYWMLCFFIVFCICTLSSNVMGQNIFDKKLSLVIIDPGHGGKDSGAKGPRGKMEKEICFRMAQLIKEKAQDNNSFNVVLTRTSDYSLSIEERVSMANYQKADIFLSIHAGASFLHNIKGVQIFTFDPKLSDMVTTDEIMNIHDGPAPELWKNVQKKHLSESDRFSAIFARQIKHFFPTKNIHRLSAPLSILRGADMPALSVELGYITHPLEEKFLDERDNLNQCAEAVIKAIQLFLSNNL